MNLIHRKTAVESMRRISHSQTQWHIETHCPNCGEPCYQMPSLFTNGRFALVDYDVCDECFRVIDYYRDYDEYDEYDEDEYDEPFNCPDCGGAIYPGDYSCCVCDPL